MIFTAGNLLPPQVIIVPLFKLYPLLPGPAAAQRQRAPLRPVLRHHPDQRRLPARFCIFVLSNYMKTISKELTEAALVDGATRLRIYRAVIMPLCRPALAALATLEFTFIYNDFFWALMLMKTGDRRPITSALNNLQGEFFTDNNLLAAGALLAAIPTILVFLAAPEAVHQRPVAGLHEGLADRATAARSASARARTAAPRSRRGSTVSCGRGRARARRAISSAPLRSPVFAADESIAVARARP